MCSVTTGTVLLKVTSLSLIRINLTIVSLWSNIKVVVLYSRSYHTVFISTVNSEIRLFIEGYSSFKYQIRFK